MSKLVHSFKSQQFAGTVGWNKETNRRQINWNSEPYLRQFLNLRCQVGDSLTITVTNKKPKRTVSQNHYYWGIYLSEISRETGEEDIERLHELFKGKFLTTEIVEVLGEKVRIKKSTTNLTVSEFVEYIMDIEKFTGILAPPTDNYFLSPIKKLNKII